MSSVELSWQPSPSWSVMYEEVQFVVPFGQSSLVSYIPSPSVSVVLFEDMTMLGESSSVARSSPGIWFKWPVKACPSKRSMKRSETAEAGLCCMLPLHPFHLNGYGWFIFLTSLFVSNIYSFISGKVLLVVEVKRIILAPIDGRRLEPIFGRIIRFLPRILSFTLGPLGNEFPSCFLTYAWNRF